MVASIRPHRHEAGLRDGSLLIGGQWGPAQSGQTWSHRHPATGEEVASFPVAGPDDVNLAVRAARREGGRTAIESYTELKTVLLPLTDEMI